ncbi:MAG TPA: LexA family transcriptional regulator [Candidatus Accumulibacter phosphatis]|nr:LexA family transcriptional regulator [Candidatus Accumulibacter phosphatis]
MNTLASRVRKAVDERNCKLIDLANAAGVKPPSVSDWLNGTTKTLKSATALRAAQFLGVSVLWLTEGVGPMRRADSPEIPKPARVLTLPDLPEIAEQQSTLVDLTNHPDLVAVPRVKFKLSAGVSGFAVEPENGNGKPVFFRKDWFKSKGYKPAKLFSVRVSGASMEPALWDGDLVVINTDDTAPTDGEAFAMNYEGELVIKRLRRDAGEWWAASDNADQRRFAPKRCTEDVKVIGRVVYKQSERI